MYFFTEKNKSFMEQKLERTLTHSGFVGLLASGFVGLLTCDMDHKTVPVEP